MSDNIQIPERKPRRKRQLGMQLASRKEMIRKLLARGEIEEAGMKCSEWDIALEDCRMDPGMETVPELATEPDEEMKLAMESKAPPPPVLPNAPTVQPAPISERWPAETDVVVYGQPINRRMALVKLADGRQAMMWKRGANFPERSKVRVKLCDQVGPDAYYEPAVS